MIEIKQECHCENPALEKAKEKGYELVCPDCWRWRPPEDSRWRKPKFVYPAMPEEQLKELFTKVVTRMFLVAAGVDK